MAGVLTSQCLELTNCSLTVIVELENDSED